MTAPSIAAMIEHGMRHVTLPKGAPVRIGIVLEYAETTVRHEFAVPAERCVCCGDVIPEGRQVCPRCEREAAG